MASPPAPRAPMRMFAAWHDGVPWYVRVVFLALLAAAGALAIHGLVGIGGNGIHTYLDEWLTCTAEWVAAVLTLIGALRSERNKIAWLLVALAIALWALGDTIWALRGQPDASVTISDVMWLAWYPLFIGALILLVRDRVPRFELHRWIDGIIVMLVVITPWVALFLQPAADRAHDSTTVATVDFAYPLADAILVGAALGVLALMGWRAAPMWWCLAIAFVALGLADAIYSVDALGHTYSSDTIFDALWLGGLLLIAYAAWIPHPGTRDPVEVFGWKAIALPVAAQLFAVGLQVYGIFFYVPIAERVLTIVVLLIAIVQIVVSRPRPPVEEVIDG